MSDEVIGKTFELGDRRYIFDIEASLASGARCGHASEVVGNLEELAVLVHAGIEGMHKAARDNAPGGMDATTALMWSLNVAGHLIEEALTYMRAAPEAREWFWATATTTFAHIAMENLRRARTASEAGS